MIRTDFTARLLRASVALLALATASCGARRAAGSNVATAPRPVDLDPTARARADSARLPYTDADVAFMSGMIHHHAQALVMAAWAPTHGASAQVQTLCERIINAQQDEIRTMQTWLRSRNREAPEPNPAGMPMEMDGVRHVMPMPGMLTEEQMSQLNAARGNAFDRLFLSFMIQHHRGAITMVRTLLSQPGAAQDEVVFKFANDVQVDQGTEIARMERMLFSATTERRPQ
ncbi:MAG: DUF305 domain-containing protein [Gemmatimonadaceae bacterium]